jgi:hypothetical protein
MLPYREDARARAEGCELLRRKAELTARRRRGPELVSSAEVAEHGQHVVEVVPQLHPRPARRNEAQRRAHHAAGLGPEEHGSEVLVLIEVEGPHALQHARVAGAEQRSERVGFARVTRGERGRLPGKEGFERHDVEAVPALPVDARGVLSLREVTIDGLARDAWMRAPSERRSVHLAVERSEVRREDHAVLGLEPIDGSVRERGTQRQRSNDFEQRILDDEALDLFESRTQIGGHAVGLPRA